MTSSPPPRRPVRVDSHRSGPLLRGWPLWGWVLLLAAALVGFLLVAALTFFSSLAAVSSCGEPLHRVEIAVAQRRLVVLLGVGLTSWVVAAWWTGRWVRLLVAAVVCVSPAVYQLVLGARDPGVYGSFLCF